MLDDPGGDIPGEDAGPAPAAKTEEVERLTDRILGGLGLDVRAKASDTETAVLVDLTGSDRDYLLSRKGEGLSALQYLLNRIVYRGRKGKKIHADSGGFRRLREEEIAEIALLAAEKVKASGEECLLSPLNPYERRLVHLALKDVLGIETQSRGGGFLKRVAILPAGKGGRNTHDL